MSVLGTTVLRSKWILLEWTCEQVKKFTAYITGLGQSWKKNASAGKLQGLFSEVAYTTICNILFLKSCIMQHKCNFLLFECSFFVSKIDVLLGFGVLFQSSEIPIWANIIPKKSQSSTSLHLIEISSYRPIGYTILILGNSVSFYI